MEPQIYFIPNLMPLMRERLTGVRICVNRFAVDTGLVHREGLYGKLFRNSAMIDTPGGAGGKSLGGNWKDK